MILVAGATSKVGSELVRPNRRRARGEGLRADGAGRGWFDQVAHALSRVVGEPVSYIPVSNEKARAELRAAGRPEFFIEEAIAHFEFWRTGAGARITWTVSELTGREPRSLADFVVDHFRVPIRA